MSIAAKRDSLLQGSPGKRKRLFAKTGVGSIFAALSLVMAVACQAPLLPNGKNLAADGTMDGRQAATGKTDSAGEIGSMFAKANHRNLNRDALEGLGLPTYRVDTIALAGDMPDRRDKEKSFPIDKALDALEIYRGNPLTEWLVDHLLQFGVDGSPASDQNWAHAILIAPDGELKFGDMPDHIVDNIYYSGNRAWDEGNNLYNGRSLQQAYNDGQPEWKDFFIGTLGHYIADACFPMHSTWFSNAGLAPDSPLGQAILDNPATRGAWTGSIGARAVNFKEKYQQIQSGYTYDSEWRHWLVWPIAVPIPVPTDEWKNRLLNGLFQLTVHIDLEEYLNRNYEYVRSDALALASNPATPFFDWSQVDYDSIESVRQAVLDMAFGSSAHSELGANLLREYIKAGMPTLAGEACYGALGESLVAMYAYIIKTMRSYFTWVMAANGTAPGTAGASGGYSRCALYIHAGGDMQKPLAIIPFASGEFQSFNAQELAALGLLNDPDDQQGWAPGIMYSPSGDISLAGLLSNSEAFESYDPPDSTWGDSYEAEGQHYMPLHSRWLPVRQPDGSFVYPPRGPYVNMVYAQAAGPRPPLEIVAMPDVSYRQGQGQLSLDFNLAGSAQTGNEIFTWTADWKPIGMTLDPTTGVLSGTPSMASGTYTMRVRVTDVFGEFDEEVVLWTHMPSSASVYFAEARAGGQTIAQNGGNIPRLSTYSLHFSEILDPATVHQGTIRLIAGNPAQQPGYTCSLREDGKTVDIMLPGPLPPYANFSIGCTVGLKEKWGLPVPPAGRDFKTIADRPVFAPAHGDKVTRLTEWTAGSITTTSGAPYNWQGFGFPNGITYTTGYRSSGDYEGQTNRLGKYTVNYSAQWAGDSTYTSGSFNWWVLPNYFKVIRAYYGWNPISNAMTNIPRNVVIRFYFDHDNAVNQVADAEINSNNCWLHCPSTNSYVPAIFTPLPQHNGFEVRFPGGLAPNTQYYINVARMKDRGGMQIENYCALFTTGNWYNSLDQ